MSFARENGMAKQTKISDELKTEVAQLMVDSEMVKAIVKLRRSHPTLSLRAAYDKCYEIKNEELLRRHDERKRTDATANGLR